MRAIDPDARTLTVSRREHCCWLALGVYGGDQVVRAEPFEVIEIALQPRQDGVPRRRRDSGLG